MSTPLFDLSFYRDRRVLITGHTGFKGGWLCKILVNAGADILGYSRGSEKNPSLFELSGVKSQIRHIRGDIRDYIYLNQIFREFQPEIVFHLAAQPIVRESYIDPRYTYETNLMGTVNLLDCIRNAPSVKSAVIVTTDKVYKNHEWPWGYRENETLNGFDPYSNSKSCAELAVDSYRNSFFNASGVPVSTVRAGNVLGGGDFAKDRVIPDCIKAIQKQEAILIRNPYSIRPYQHVLDPLFAYLMIARKQFDNPGLAGAYNIGPDERDCLTTGELVDLFCKKWGEGASWESRAEKNAPHESKFLKLDCSLIKQVFDWKPRWHIEYCVELVCKFYKLWLTGEDISQEMDREIREFLKGDLY